MWDADQYLRYEAERTRPFLDLMAQVSRESTARIVDLGCGPGNLTRLLADRWPEAQVTGVDSSADMLQTAAALAVAGRIDFQQADLAAWSPREPVDLVVSSAAWQWIADHELLIDHCVRMLAQGGTLAVQMPCRFGTSSQTVIEEVSADPRWADRLQGVGLHRHSVHPVTWYAEQLSRRGFVVNAWDTTYLHALTGENPVLDWLRGTALRPLLARLNETQQVDFLTVLGERLRAEFPPCGEVTFFPMPRLFFVAKRK
ncbi:MAG: methyltransferase domain-containing protein [Planctomycetes bacterium]|nr:methyltransferase domain-containing protein [Planctomycetota bacterium]